MMATTKGWKYNGQNVEGIRMEGAGASINADGSVNPGTKHSEPVRAVRSRRKGMGISINNFDDNWDRIFNKKQD